MYNRGGRRGRARSSNRGGGRRGDGAGTSNHDAGTSDSGPSRTHKWTPRTTRIMLELVIEELEAEDYTVRLPLGPGKQRVEEKLYELTGARVKWRPEIKGKLDHLRRLWYYNKTLSGRTGVYVNQTRKIEMIPSWWEDRCAEVDPKNRKYITNLQNNPLPFKDLLDIIYSKHDVDQDDSYSPHMLGVHLDQTENEEINDDDVDMDKTEEYDRTSSHRVDLNLDASDDDLPSLSRSPVRSTRDRRRDSPYPDRRPSSRVRNTSTRRTHMRRVNFQTQIDGRLQRMEESRGELLNVMCSRQSSKPTYGDALAVLESLPIEPMNTFWWEANKLLMNDEDIRDGFMKLQSEENKIRHLERLAGVDRYGNP